MIALKDLRRDLTSHLAAGLGAAATKLGAQVNPPTVIVQPGTEYLTPAPGYCIDGIEFQAFLIPKAGDLAAEMDALDDMVDLVRATLRTNSPAGHRFSFLGAFTTTYGADAGRTFPAVAVTVRFERDNDA